MITNCSGTIPRGENALLFDLYTPKSIGLNAPAKIRDLPWTVQETYWREHPNEFQSYIKGLNKRDGNDPPTFMNVNEGAGNAIGFSNSGLQSVLDEAYAFVKIERDKGINLRINESVFMQNEWELSQLMNLSMMHKAFEFIEYIELNISCPNTHAGETATLRLNDDITKTNNQIKNYVGIAGNTGKKVLVKFSLSDESTPYVEPAVRAGAYGIVDGNTVQGAVHNYYTQEFMYYCGYSGPDVHQRMLKVISDHNNLRNKLRNENLDFIIISNGGNKDGPSALEAITAGADLIGMGTAFKNKSPDEIASIINDTKSYLAKYDLDSIRGTKVFDNPAYWTDPNAWLHVGNQRKLKIYSKDHQSNIVKSVTPVSSDSVKVEFEKSIGDFDIGQFFGLMYRLNNNPNERPQERPFTPFDNHSFIIHDLRKHAELHRDNPNESKKLEDSDYGLFTHAAASLKPGQQVYIRGPVGKGLQLEGLGRILAVGGGCGSIALVELKRRTGCDVRLAFADKGEVMLEDIANSIHVDNEYGGILPVHELLFKNYDSTVVCGPPEMMFSTAAEAVRQGMNPQNVKLIIEGMVKCFNGLSGCCSCNKNGHSVCLEPAVTYAKLLEDDEFLIRGKHSGIVKRIKLR